MKLHTRREWVHLVLDALDHPVRCRSDRQEAFSDFQQSASRDALRAEVDRILDKINLHGFGSLTPAEKRVLDDARQHLNHR